MPAADTPQVEQAVQDALANESATELCMYGRSDPPTVNDAQRIIACLQQTPRIDTLTIQTYSLHDDAVLNVFRDGLPLCTSVTTVNILGVNLGNEELDRLRPAFSNTSIRKLWLHYNNRIEGQRGGEVLRDLLVGNNTLRELWLSDNSQFGPEGAIGFGQGLADNNGLQILNLSYCRIGNEGLANLLLPANGGIINNSLLHLNLYNNNIDGEEGGQQVSSLLQRFPALKVLVLGNNPLGSLGAHALAPGLAAASQLESLGLHKCALGNDGVASLVPDGQVNRTLTNLGILGNNIEGTDGGRQVTLLLQRFPALKVLHLDCNNLGPLGARALAPGLAAASHLESLDLQYCHLGNDGVASLIPDGQVNTSLTTLNLNYNGIQGTNGGENLIALASRCTNLDSLDSSEEILSPDQQRHLDLLLDRKRLCTEASALGGSTFPILFRFVEKAHHHEHGLSSIFVILQNDGDGYFCSALNRAIE